jgi:microcystin-dependent protein
MGTPFLGEIRLFGGNFAPLGYAFCSGQILSISQNDALFALIGTTYGGDGQTTFALPDLRGRIPVHVGQGPGLSSYVLGQSGGAETVTLTTQQLPAHTHAAQAQSAAGNQAAPGGGVWAASGQNQFSSNAPNAAMSNAAIGSAGGSQPHDNAMPYQVISFIIALEGIFPSRN